MYDSMFVIDAHTHIFPEKIARSAVLATGQFYANAHNEQLLAPVGLTNGQGTAEDLLRENKAAGIDRSVVFSTATAARQVESINNFISRECEEHPEFIGLGTMHIDYPDFETEVRRIKSLGSWASSSIRTSSASCSTTTGCCRSMTACAPRVCS